MICPYCEFEGSRGQVHQHLASAHADKVILRTDNALGNRYYGIICPICQAPYEHRVKPRNEDPNFLIEFDREIKLVAFDMLLYHMQGEHGDTSTGHIQTTRE